MTAPRRPCCLVAGALDHAGVFAYSNEPRTAASRLPAELHVPRARKLARQKRLSYAQLAVARKRHARLVGQRLTVVVDAVDGGAGGAGGEGASGCSRARRTRRRTTSTAQS